MLMLADAVVDCPNCMGTGCSCPCHKPNSHQWQYSLDCTYCDVMDGHNKKCNTCKGTGKVPRWDWARVVCNHEYWHKGQCLAKGCPGYQPAPVADVVLGILRELSLVVTIRIDSYYGTFEVSEQSQSQLTVWYQIGEGDTVEDALMQAFIAYHGLEV